MSTSRSHVSGGRELGLVFTVALVLRLAFLVVFDTAGGIEGKTPWAWACEPACLADSLARGDGISDPFGRDTGPSAWLTPLYPGLLAASWKLFGGMTPAAATAVFLVQAIVSALTAMGLFLLGRRMSGPLTARLAGWGWALHPTAAWYSIQQVWDTTLVAGGLVAIVLALVSMGRGPRPGRALAFGLGFGVLLLVNPAPIGVLPVVLWYLAPGGGARAALLRIAAFGVGTLVVCAPWMARNMDVLGTSGMRSNLGVELRVGNNDASNGWHQKSLHPGWNDEESERMREMGERAYAVWAGDRAKEWILEDPVRFVSLSLKRVQLVWLGVVPSADTRSEGGTSAAADPKSWVRWIVHLITGIVGIAGLFVLGRGTPEGWLVRGIVVLFGAPYYITHVLERYRFPMDPLLILAGAALVAALLSRLRPDGEVEVRPDARPAA